MRAAVRAFLDIAARNVKLPLGYGAVMTRRRVGPPTEAFVAISDSSEHFAVERVVR
jgi:hypothetical protein